jgi:AraC-like DNA-binding protein
MQMTTTAFAPSCKDQEIQLEIQTLQGLREQRVEQDQMPHRHQHIEIVWVRGGNGSLNIDLKRYKMGNNTLYCIIPGQLHQLEIDDEAQGYIISFPEYLLNSGNDDFELLYRSGLFHLLMHSPGIRMEEDTADEIEEIIRRYTSIFLIYLARQFDGAMQVSVQTKNVGLVKNFIALVEKKYMNWKLVKDYAGELSVTPNYLNEIVKKISGYSAGYHIRQRVVLEAKRRAAYSNVSMKEIAYHLGFEDIAHFSKFFKTVYGKNFTDFKKESFTHFS